MNEDLIEALTDTIIDTFGAAQKAGAHPGDMMTSLSVVNLNVMAYIIAANKNREDDDAVIQHTIGSMTELLGKYLSDFVAAFRDERDRMKAEREAKR